MNKVCLIVNSFDATELLDLCIKQVRDHVDFVLLSTQEKSYNGVLCSEEDEARYLELHEKGIIDAVITYDVDNRPMRVQEWDKRNKSLKYARDLGYSHAIMVDEDEIYDTNQFAKAKEMFFNKGLAASYVRYVNYYKDFHHVIDHPSKDAVVPFIQSTSLQYNYGGHAPAPCDPTRRILNPVSEGYIFDRSVIEMHHASWIRNDIRKKIRNWSAKDSFSKRELKEVISKWENWKEGDRAKILFKGKPNCKVTKVERKIDFEL